MFSLMPAYRCELPAYRLCLGVVEDATLLMHHGYDGLVLDRAGRPIRETTFYGHIFQHGLSEGRIDVADHLQELQQGFVAFDSSWWVYYHWLVFCLGAAGVAIKLVPPECKILIPDFEACAPARPQGVSAAVFNEVGRVAGADRLAPLTESVYRIARANILFVENGAPSDAALHPFFDDVFQSLKQPVARRRRGRRLMVSRGGHGGPGRVTPEEEAAFNTLTIEYGFRTERLERLSFQAQVDLFSTAKIIVAPHGSGLANLVFVRKTPKVKVVELQTELDGPGRLRPWFYVLAAAGGRTYAFLNRAAGDFTADRLQASLAALGVRRPSRLVRLIRTTRSRLDRRRRREPGPTASP